VYLKSEKRKKKKEKRSDTELVVSVLGIEREKLCND